MEIINLNNSLNLNQKNTIKKEKINKNLIKVRKASISDVEAIYEIACSVGSKTKNSYEGFLMDNYVSRPKKYKTFFKDRINELEHFYIAESNNNPLGFLMAYTKEKWLKYNPTWIEDIYWSPIFDMNKTDNFVVIDKTAILHGYTGKGIGSILYKSLIKDLKKTGIKNIFAETIINPTPNFASLAFRKKQKYILAGVRYEEYEGQLYTDLIYYKPVK
ncbi:Acetyltransferase (GNAT) family protein [Caminicella sporogenes DSM 14501]|uniref:Acetyltransferase (GNAT) family protein n=1 Tax=Caminicella sporogenes DSM 14501 TaxID=1121266 RepID=A0A1M6S5M3_9FIRM|nr:GNAT family N-acetyltransferase [Caminicella sporogenes]RKD27204.1 GCN5 family acetyltransferase [Caminicella sporogenes]SHK40016.1 Acetyltransferase (GNAT) family protein [Caminicella sporogenes DSM 14501]